MTRDLWKSAPIPPELKLCQPTKELNKCSRSPELLGSQEGILIKSNLLIRYILNVIITQR